MYAFIKKYSERIRSEAGFTLLEIIIALIVTSIIMTSITPFIKVQVNSYISCYKAKYSMQTVRIGMKRIVSEIHDARGATSSDINTASTTEFDFYNEDGERIELSYGKFTASGKSSWCVLFRVGSSSTAMPLIYNVSACKFTYLDSAGSSTTSKPDIRIIRIEITVQDPDSGDTFSTANQVAPSNFRS